MKIQILILSMALFAACSHQDENSFTKQTLDESPEQILIQLEKNGNKFSEVEKAEFIEKMSDPDNEFKSRTYQMVDSFENDKSFELTTSNSCASYCSKTYSGVINFAACLSACSIVSQVAIKITK